MAFFRIDIKSIKRSAGQRATAAAAYRAGERIRDEGSGTVHNHSRRKDVTHAEIFLPSWFRDSPVEWARNRATLWNAAEAAEKRSDSKVAREFQVALPAELSASQRLALARSFAREISDRYGTAVDLAVHDPKTNGDPRQFHAHLLTTTREVTPSGLGAKVGLDMAPLERAKWGLATGSEEYTAVRERWATLNNEALRDANIDVRVDHRSLAAQGIYRQPIVHIPMEFHRGTTEELDPAVRARLREEYKARVAARAEPSEVRSEPSRSHDVPGNSRDEKPLDTRSVEEIRRDAVQSWLRMRPREAESSADKSAVTEVRQGQHGRAAPNVTQEQHEERGPGGGPDGSLGQRTRSDRELNSARESARDATPASSPALEDDAAM